MKPRFSWLYSTQNGYVPIFVGSDSGSQLQRHIDDDDGVDDDGGGVVTTFGWWREKGGRGFVRTEREGEDGVD